MPVDPLCSNAEWPPLQKSREGSQRAQERLIAACRGHAKKTDNAQLLEHIRYVIRARGGTELLNVNIALFIAASLAVIVAPGPDNIYVLTRFAGRRDEHSFV